MPHQKLEKEPGLIRPENKDIAKQVQLLLVSLLFWVLENIVKIEISDETIKNLEALDQQLKESSAVVYSYHSSSFDPPILALILSKKLDNVDTFIAPVAITHYQGVEKVFIKLLGSLIKSEPMPVVREKDLEEYGVELQKTLLRQLLKVSKEKLQKPHSILALAPTATRENELRSENVQPGFTSIAKKYQLPMIPVAYVQKKDGKKEFLVGKPLPAPDKSQPLEESINFYMTELARLLPEELKGDYL